MHKKLAALALVLCCGAMVAGCAKKGIMPGTEPAASTGAGTGATATTPALPETKPAVPVQPLTEQPVKQEPVSDAPSLKEQPAGNAAVEAALETVYFEYDSFVLSPAARESLAKNAQYLIKNPGVKIQVEGHCDARGGDDYNLALGEKRANAVMRYLETLGVAGNRMTAISYGKEKPAVEGDDEAAWAKNRRVAFVAQ